MVTPVERKSQHAKSQDFGVTLTESGAIAAQSA